MRLLLAGTAAALLAAGCSDSTSAPVATRVVVTPASVAFDAVGDRRVVRAVAHDRNGRPVPSAVLAWHSSSAAVTIAEAAGDSAVLISAGGGAATVTASAGSAVGTLTVDVSQRVTLLEASQAVLTSEVGAPFPHPLRVVARDRLGTPVAGVAVSFTAAEASGSVSPATVVSGPDGVAEATWTLGTFAGFVQRVTASAGSAIPVTFTVMGAAGPPAAAHAVGGDWSVAARNGPVPLRPRVRVLDGYGNFVIGAPVQFTVTSGGGRVSGGSQLTDEFGTATVGEWVLGPAVGENTLAAILPGTDVPAVVFTARGVEIGEIVLLQGSGQMAMGGTAVPVAPRVRVRGADGNPLPGVVVSFEPGGDGRVLQPTAVTDAAGEASAGEWVLGTGASINELTVRLQDVHGAAVSVTAVGCGGGGTRDAFAITLCFLTPVDPLHRAAYEQAAARWARVVRGDLPDIPNPAFPAGACGPRSPALNFTIDDLVIFVSIERIDGPAGILGQAGWCARRDGGLPAIGLMIFDEYDLHGPHVSWNFVDVVMHEMGHVLGLSAPLWSSLGLLKNPTVDGGTVVDTYFAGAGAIAAFDAIGGAGYPMQKVPVEHTGGAGTANSHWRESVLGNELMTGWLNSGANPLSLVTVRALADMGYVVDLTAADPFSLTFGVRHGPDQAVRLHDDEYQGPRWEIGAGGARRRLR